MKQNLLKKLLVCLLIFSSMPTFAYDCKVDGIYYNLDEFDRIACVTYSSFMGNSYSGVVNIPESIEYDDITYSVTAIEENAFSGSFELTKVVIGNNVVSIGDMAFSVTELTEVTIGSSVAFFGSRVFEGTPKLEKIVVAEDNPYYDSREDCNAIIRTDENELIVACKNTRIPTSVTSIGEYAFSTVPLNDITIPGNIVSIGNNAFWENWALTKVTIENGVTSIGNGAFAFCHYLVEVTIPSSVISIGTGAFRGCSNLAKIVVEEDNPYYDSREDCNAIIRTEDNELIVGCKNTHIPNNVTSIGYFAFGGCEYLTEVVIPNNVTSIKEYAFSLCSNLTKATLGSGITFISYDVFDGCSSLTSLISLSTTPPELPYEDYTFYGMYQTVTLYVPKGCKGAYEQAIGWRDFANIVESDSEEEIAEKKNEAEAACKAAKAVYEQYMSYYEGDGKAFYQQVVEIATGNCIKNDEILTTIESLEKGITESGLTDEIKATYLKTLNDIKESTSVLATENNEATASNQFYDRVQKNFEFITAYQNRLVQYEERIGSAITVDELDALIAEIKKDADETKYSHLDPIASDYEDLEKIEQELIQINKELGDLEAQLQAVSDEVNAIVTSISSVTNSNTEMVIVYTIDGKSQTMKKSNLKSLPKGIYIVDGKKVVVK